MATRSARTADKTTTDKHARILKALLQKPCNKFCVDCRKKDPRWASFNLGCFMCIRCSGVHRSMGTHISKVKSVDLDNWTAEQVENMIKWGNEKANMYWEARLPESSIPNENTSGIDPWIRSKYEWKQFTNKGPVPDPSELGPIDETMLMDLYGNPNSHSRSRANDRSAESSESFGIIAPPPSYPTRSSVSKRPTSVLGGVQSADLFSFGQQHSSSVAPIAAAQQDFFGLDDPEPTSPAVAQAKRASIQSPQLQQSAQNSATQDLFSLVAPAPSQGQPAPATAPSTSQTQQPKASNTDWKTSIMSLYGNQPSGFNRNSMGYATSIPQQQQQQQQQQHQQQQQQQQHQQQQQQTAQFSQQQNMNTFGFGLQSQPQQQQPNLWSDNDGFGAMQQASVPSTSSSFGSFGMGSNTEFGGVQTNSGSNRPAGANNNAVPQGGDFFNMIAGAAQSPATNPPAQNKNNRYR
ncbi:hypothetical protein BGZ54_010157 [Gamsiella multidivaricata]|nr:hypothetical protein BGZ54_010157 [Gamsiella multidivaricata]